MWLLLCALFAMPVAALAASPEENWEATISDASETGLAFLFDDPQFIPEDTPLLVGLHYRERDLFLCGRVVHIAPAGDKWKYSVHFDDMHPEDKRYYREYVYDRPHSLPKQIDSSVSLLDDFNLRLGKRAQPIQESMRKLPRVRLELPFTFTNGGEGVLVDFNYRYANIQTERELPPDATMKIDVILGFSLQLKQVEDNPTLYRVTNSEQFVRDEDIAHLLTQLSGMVPREKAALNAKATVAQVL